MDIYIGDKPERKMCSAVRFSDTYDFLSHNSFEYWHWTEDCHLRINKESSEGVEITLMIENSRSWVTLENFLVKLAISKMTPSQILKIFNRRHDKGYESGQSDKIKEFKKVMRL